MTVYVVPKEYCYAAIEVLLQFRKERTRAIKFVNNLLNFTFMVPCIINHKIE
jgi:hypothetical protein